MPVHHRGRPDRQRSDALQHISYYHTEDYVQALGRRMKGRISGRQGRDRTDTDQQSNVGDRSPPICQDTGIVTVFVKWGQACTLASDRRLQSVIDEGVRRAYSHPSNPLRASIVSDPALSRRNTRDNTPSVVHVEMVPGDSVQVTVAQGAAPKTRPSSRC